MAQEIRHLELLLGMCVYAPDGSVAGRIEEVRAAQQSGEWVVVEYLIGTTALFRRLSFLHVGLALLRLFGANKLPAGYRIPWQQLDLADPDRPLLRCPLDELETL